VNKIQKWWGGAPKRERERSRKPPRNRTGGGKKRAPAGRAGKTRRVKGTVRGGSREFAATKFTNFCRSGEKGKKRKPYEAEEATRTYTVPSITLSQPWKSKGEDAGRKAEMGERGKEWLNNRPGVHFEGGERTQHPVEHFRKEGGRAWEDPLSRKSAQNSRFCTCGLMGKIH